MQQAVCVQKKKKKEKRKKKHGKRSVPPKTHHEIHSSPATASSSRRHAMKHVTHVSPYSPESKYTGFVQIGLVQLSQSAKTTNVTHTDRHGLKLFWHPVRTPVWRGFFAQRQMTASSKIRRTQKTPRNPQPSGHRDQLEAARGETRPTR